MFVPNDLADNNIIKYHGRPYANPFFLLNNKTQKLIRVEPQGNGITGETVIFSSEKNNPSIISTFEPEELIEHKIDQSPYLLQSFKTFVKNNFYLYLAYSKIKSAIVSKKETHRIQEEGKKPKTFFADFKNWKTNFPLLYLENSEWRNRHFEHFNKQIELLLNRLKNEVDAKIIVTTFPSQFQINAAQSDYTKTHELFTFLDEQNIIEYLPLHHIVVKEGINLNKFYAKNNKHFNYKGNAYIAKKIAEFIRERQLL